MGGHRIKIAVIISTLFIAVYLALPFMLIPITIGGGGSYAGSILNVAYSPFFVRLSEQNTYRASLTSYANKICSENPGKCKNEQYQTK